MADTDLKPNSGGLSGRWASVANLSAVGAFILLAFLGYRDFIRAVRERDELIRDEIHLSREANEYRNAALSKAVVELSAKVDALTRELAKGKP